MNKLNELIDFYEMTEADPELLVMLLELRRHRQDNWKQRAEAAEAQQEPAAFRLDPKEGPSYLSFRCGEDLKESGFDFADCVPLFTRPAPAVSLAEKVAPTVRLKRGLLKHKFDDKWFAVSDCYEISTHYVATLDEDGVSRNYPKHMYEFRTAILRNNEESK